jgi:hypothetical protein
MQFGISNVEGETAGAHRDHIGERQFLENLCAVLEDVSEGRSGPAVLPSGLTGYSGMKVIATLQKLAQSLMVSKDTCYLEIGVFQGLTLLSVAAAVPRCRCFGIDNFAFFDPDNRNLSIVEQRRSSLGLTNAEVVNEDFELALASLRRTMASGRVALYFVDGPHDYRSQLLCLQLAVPHLHERCAIVVDDCNYEHVRQANRDFLVTHRDFKLLFEAYTPCHPHNMVAAELSQAKAGWWNGINVLVRDPADLLPSALPQTSVDRTRYQGDHIVHAAEMAELLQESGPLLSALHHYRPLRFVVESLRLKWLMHKSRERYARRFRSMNTFSERLPPVRITRPREGSV